jgi:hypothetical protein
MHRHPILVLLASAIAVATLPFLVWAWLSLMST